MNTKFGFRCVALTMSTLFALVLVSKANPHTTRMTFTVTSTGSNRLVPGTLSWAIDQANYHGADVNTINFNILNVHGQVEILENAGYLNELYIARLMILDGTSQPGYDRNTRKPIIRINAHGNDSAIQLVGRVSGVPPYSDGSQASSSGSTIQGLQIFNYNRGNAITVSKESEGDFIQHNWIGFSKNANGTFNLNSTFYPLGCGIGIQSSFTTVRFNTISGVYHGIRIGENVPGTWSGTNYRANHFESNNIGTDPSGSEVIGNTFDGVFLGEGASENIIGPFNVLSGNAFHGVELLHSSTKGNIITANLIGTDCAGTTALGNGHLGVLIANGADYNYVGGPSGGNVISGNDLGGVAIGTELYQTPCTRIYVESNLIGTDATGLRPIGRQRVGITSQYGSQTTMARNVICGHTVHGVLLYEVGTPRPNGVFGNWIGKAARSSAVTFGTTRGSDQGVHLLQCADTTDGRPLPNQGYGVFVWSSRGNHIQIPRGTENCSSLHFRNIFGSNALGPAGFQPNDTEGENVYFR